MEFAKLHSDCGPVEAARRFEARAREASHDRAAHPLPRLSPELLAEYDRPMGLGAVLRVDTRDPADVQSVARLVTQAWALQGV